MSKKKIKFNPEIFLICAIFFISGGILGQLSSGLHTLIFGNIILIDIISLIVLAIFIFLYIKLKEGVEK
jgi:hypothetical protein